MDDIQAQLDSAGLLEALKLGRFSLFCQPIVPIAAPKSDHKYLEIFVRFAEEEDKLLPPGMFFPILEASHLTPMLDRWVVREVLKWAAERRDSRASWQIPRFNINLADDTVRDKDFPGYVLDTLYATRVPPNRLWFELTAQQMAHLPEAAKQLIASLDTLGCHIAVSDFSGTEATARSYWNAGVKIVKLAGSMVRDAHKNAGTYSALVAVIALCQKFGMQTVAQFVEERETLAILHKVGVDYAQGFGMAVPLPLRLVV